MGVDPVAGLAARRWMPAPEGHLASGIDLYPIGV